MADLVVLLCDFQSSLDQFDVGPGRLDPLGGLLLESMQHIHDFLESNGIEGAIRVAVMVLDQFEDTRSLTLPGLGGRVLAPELRQTQGIAHFILPRLRKVRKSLLDEPTQSSGLSPFDRGRAMDL